MELLRGPDGVLYRVTAKACSVVEECARVASVPLPSAGQVPSVDDDGTSRQYITG